jgi:hypothetical protein
MLLQLHPPEMRGPTIIRSESALARRRDSASSAFIPSAVPPILDEPFLCEESFSTIARGI